MKIERLMPFEDLRELCFSQNAPVYPRRRINSGKTFFVRRPGFTVQDVEDFFKRLAKDQRTITEQSPKTTNQGQTPFGSF